MGAMFPRPSDPDNAQNNDLQQLPLVYTSNYNIGFMKLELLHPFDSRKYEKIYNALIKSRRVNSMQFIEPTECDQHTLKLVHTQSYLDTLKDSNVVANLVEVPPVSFLHHKLVQKYLLSPMRYATNGSLIAAERAYLHYGWAINLSGGYHHASAAKGGGFCIYADISLIIVDLLKKYGKYAHKSHKTPLEKIMILDLDAHQGNGHGTDKKNLIYKNCGAQVLTVDFYNNGIFPHDYCAKKGIDVDVPLHFHMEDEEYLGKLRKILPTYLNEFKPEFVIYNSGTDVLIGDPLGILDITEDGVIERDYIVFDECFKRKVPIVMLLSGGYQQTNAQIITKSILNLDDKFNLFKQPHKLNSDIRQHKSEEKGMDEQEFKNDQSML